MGILSAETAAVRRKGGSYLVTVDVKTGATEVEVKVNKVVVLTVVLQFKSAFVSSLYDVVVIPLRRAHSSGSPDSSAKSEGGTPGTGTNSQAGRSLSFSDLSCAELRSWCLSAL